MNSKEIGPGNFPKTEILSSAESIDSLRQVIEHHADQIARLTETVAQLAEAAALSDRRAASRRRLALVVLPIGCLLLIAWSIAGILWLGDEPIIVVLASALIAFSILMLYLIFRETVLKARRSRRINTSGS